jgi:diacylglycerol O-acyltransferase / wax synthase
MNRTAETGTLVFFPKLTHRLSIQDASFLYGETASAPMHIATWSVFDGHVGRNKLIRHMERRMPLLPRFRQRLGFAPFNLAHPAWEDDEDFDLERHVIRHRFPNGTRDEEIEAAAIKVFEKPLDWRRPLWQLHTFEGLRGGRTGLLSLAHHCLADGISGVQLTDIVMDRHPNPSPESEPLNLRPMRSPAPVQALLEAVRDDAERVAADARRFEELLFDPAGAIRKAREALERFRSLARTFFGTVVATPWNAGLVGSRRRLAWLRYPLREVRRIRKTLGGTPNDLALTMLSEGAARYLRHHGYPAAGAKFRIGCPVNVRRGNDWGKLGNRVSMMFPELSAEPMEPLARLEEVRAETLRAKASHAVQALEQIVTASELVPPSLVALVSAIGTRTIDLWVRLSEMLNPQPSFRPARPARNFGVSFIATNVPGAQDPLYLLGRRCLDQVGMIPLGGNLGYGVAILSYNQNLYLTMTSEPRLMPDVELMKSYVDQVYAELASAAGVRDLDAAASIQACAS